MVGGSAVDEQHFHLQAATDRLFVFGVTDCLIFFGVSPSRPGKNKPDPLDFADPDEITVAREPTGTLK